MWELFKKYILEGFNKKRKEKWKKEMTIYH
jgi:hypothetical protein